METLRISLEQGIIEGAEARPARVAAFLGLPYAAAPVGPRRFERPCPPFGWRGVRQALGFAARCPQRPPFADLVFRSPGASEDCLFVNVWTPAPGDSAARLPVLIYIHGGAFLVGDGSEPRYDGASIAAQGVVVATVNYRLGVLGFFAHPDLECANAGLLDLAAALDWIRANAGAFGGDPGRIMLAGSSSGAFAVCTLAASPRTQGMIAGTIVQSGALLGSQLTGLGAELGGLDGARRRGREFARSMGAADLQALKAAPVELLLKAASSTSWNRPVIDGDLLQRDLYASYAAGAVAAAPLLIGATSAERDFEARAGRRPLSLGSFMASLKRQHGQDAGLVYAAYGSPRSEAEVGDAFRRWACELWVDADTFRFAQAASSMGRQVYAYLFDHTRPEPVPGSGGWTSRHGAAHSTDSEYFTGSLNLSEGYAWGPADRRLSDRMLAYVANFVRTGNPNGEGLPAWPRFNDGRRLILSPDSATEPLSGLAGRAALLSRTAGRKAV